MAKWGDGDPRWIVEHRDDGKNVNNWHWSEKNKLAWSKQRLAELLPGAEARLEGAGAPSGSPYLARVTEVKSVDGEAMITTRKGNKRFAFYDLKMTLAWTAAPDAPPAAAAAEGAEGGEAAALTPAEAAVDALANASLGRGGSGEGEAEQPPEEGAPEGEAGGASLEAAEPAAVAATAAAAPAAPTSSAPAISGEIVVSEFGSGSDHDDIELTVTVTGGTSEEQATLRRHVQVTLWPLVLQLLEQYVRELGEQ